MSEAPTKEITLTGGALVKPRRRGTSTRRTRQEGGNSGALLQLVAQSAPASGVDTGVQARASEAANVAAAALRQIGGPAAIPVTQRGGDNSGGLLQVASVPNVGGPMNTQQFAAAFRSQVGQILNSQFGPAKAQQFGGRKGQRGGDVTAGTIQKASSYAPTLPDSPAPVGTISGVAAEQPAPVGGARRLVLAPPKRKTRIALKAKKLRGGSESAEKTNVPPMAGGATRKARKIHLRVKGVTSRLAKAKKAKKQAMAAPIADVRAKLEAAGVVKKGSKAPESMLRNMYADLLITKKGL